MHLELFERVKAVCVSHSFVLIGLGEYLRLRKVWLLVSFVFCACYVRRQGKSQFLLFTLLLIDIYVGANYLLIKTALVAVRNVKHTSVECVFHKEFIKTCRTNGK